MVQKRLQNAQKISACGGHIIIEIRLVNVPKVYFRLRRTKISIVVFYACLQGRAPLHNHKSQNCPPLQQVKITMLFSLCVYTGRLYTSIKLRFFVRAAAGQNRSAV